LGFREEKISLRRAECPHGDLEDLPNVLDTAGEQDLEILALADFASESLVDASHAFLFHALKRFVDTGSGIDVHVLALMQGNGKGLTHACIGDGVLAPRTEIA